MVFTGQHDLDPDQHGFQGCRSIRLAIAGRSDPNSHVEAVTRSLSPLLRGGDLAIVQGDTSSALGGALAASIARVPVAHVEAGLRSHDRNRPWPEEEYRVAIDGIAELLFAPTELAAANLRRERVVGAVHVTGNTAIDAVLALRPRLPRPAKEPGCRPPRLLVTCHRRESWGEGMDSIAAALREIAHDGTATVEIVLHPNPAVESRVRSLLAGKPGIVLTQPRPHREMLWSMLGCDLLLSDSGGMQEEAAALGIPMLVLRDRTERPEAIASGTMALAGTGTTSIVDAVKQAIERLPGVERKDGDTVYGDGRAGKRIASIVCDWLEERIAAKPVQDLARIA